MTPEAFSDFWAGRELWAEPLFAGVLAAAVLGYLGVFIVLKRMVFVSAALSQASGVTARPPSCPLRPCPPRRHS